MSEGVDPVRILRALLPGSYSTGSGYPGSDRDMEEFVREVRRRVPELAGEDDETVVREVVDAVSWAFINICRPLKGKHRVKHGPNYFEERGVFSCCHPELGPFRLSFYEEMNADAGVWHFGFELERLRRTPSWARAPARRG